jgi:hypothetical protein
MHSAADRELRLGVPPNLVFQEVLGRPPTSHEVASLALAPATTAALRRILEGLDSIASTMDLDSLHPAVVMEYVDSCLKKGWKFSSVLTTSRNIAMLAARREYHPLLSSPEFQDLRRGLSRLAALESPKQALVMTFASLTSLMERLLARKEREMAAIIALAWLLAGRLGEVALIPLDHFFPEESPVRVKFSVMKGVFGAQEKSLAEGFLCSVATKWHRRRSRKQPPPRRMFSLSPTQVIACLRKEIDPALSGHSIRRGALTHGDQRGSNSHDLMALSSHKSTQMLQRYIGRASSDRRDAMLRAGSILAQP